MRKAISVFLAITLLLTGLSVLSAGAQEETAAAPAGFTLQPALYAHAVCGAEDGEAWQAWQSPHYEDYSETDSSIKYFFLPVSADSSRAEVYNAYSEPVTVNGVTLEAGAAAAVPYDTDSAYSVKASGRTYTLRFMHSTAEAAIYINNSDADGNGTALFDYLAADKSRKAAATGAIVTPDGSIDNTPVSKIKGRGNTSWGKSKKGFNITYKSKVSVAGMKKSKKYSILANYQDDSLSRNRFLYDLSDAVGMPYASDSRYVDFYINGFYWGSYQMCEKIEAGDLVYDVDDKAYLNEDKTVRDDFSFIAEVDASAQEGEDYFFYAKNGSKVTIKAPELEAGDPGYEEVKAYVKEKFDAFAAETKKRNGKVSNYADVDSVAKLYLINELGKNWDSGVSSTFFTYKPDENGVYKFYGSPVWDYDNSLGNANGVDGELRNMGVSDYTQFSGWWCKYKGKGKSERVSGSNIINQVAVNTEVQNAVPAIWFEEFMPAIRHFTGETKNPITDTELYSADRYYSLVSGSAAMNYTSGWYLTTSGWIADHSTLKKATYDTKNHTYSLSDTATRYEQNFKDMYRYTCDWFSSRAAWLSNEYWGKYKKEPVYGDANRDGVTDITDATFIQRVCADMEVIDSAYTFELADVGKDGFLSVVDATGVQRMIAGI